MGGSRSNQAAGFSRDSMTRSKEMFSAGLPLFQKGVGMAQQAFAAGGEPEYMSRALDGALANAQDASHLQANQDASSLAFQAKTPIAGGNTSMALQPESYGAKMARLVAESSVGRQNSRMSQMLDAAGVMAGQMGGAGDAQTRALSNQLGAISMQPAVDPTYAAIVGAANAAGTIYGAGDKAGWWSKGSGAPPIGTGSIRNANSIGIWGQPGQYGTGGFGLGSQAYPPAWRP